MSSLVRSAPSRFPSTPWGHLPPRMSVLFIRGRCRTGGWLAEAFAADSASEILLEEVQGVAAGLTRLRDEMFDAVLISQEPQDLDALDVLDAIRAGSRDRQPIVVLGEEDEQEMAALCYEAGADAYVCLRTATTRGLIWQLARAVERHALLAENRRLTQERQSQLQREQEEAERLLEQQRAMLATVPASDSGSAAPELPVAERPVAGRPITESRVAESASADGLAEEGAADGQLERRLVAELPDSLVAYYRELLRTYVMMGLGNLAREMTPLCRRLADARLAPRQIVALHVSVVSDLVQGLGSRSARHVLHRADLLILEVLTHLAEDYRQVLLDQPAARRR